ncbi:MAG: hypothetical protein ACP5HU_09345 [Phycisphaerae bacterium]
MESMSAAMRKLSAILCIMVLTVTVAAQVVSRPATRDSQPDPVERIAELWQRLRRMDVGDEDFLTVRDELLARAARLPRQRRAEAAARLMRRGAADSVNAAAIRLFGPDPIPDDDVREILFDTSRSFQQRILVRTYYLFCRDDFDDSLLSSHARRELIGLLAERLEGLNPDETGYGEQRLMIHLCSDALAWCEAVGVRGGVCERLTAAMRSYAASADSDDTLAASIWGWLTLKGVTDVALNTVDGAVEALGHWDPLVRWRAAAALAERVQEDEHVAERVLDMLDDPRDEARAAAVRVFAFAPNVFRGDIEPRLANMLVRDRGVVVQAAVADAIATRTPAAAETIDTLLGAFRTRIPGPKRTDSILQALANLVDYADERQIRRMVEIASGKIAYAPQGALELLEALGPVAAPAIEEIVRYRTSADRVTRRFIDRQVLPAIRSSTSGTTGRDDHAGADTPTVR